MITSKLWGLLPTAPYVVPSIEYPTIADAVEAAATALNAGSTDLATVLISPGTYDKPGSFGISVGLTKGTLAIEARQANGATVIDCKDSPFITIEQRGTGQAVISGLTIQNGDSTTLNGGGAITSSCALSLIGCRFFGNKARGDGSGGAVGVSGGADTIPLNVEGCLFYANSGVGGGALALVAARATVGRSTFYGNSLPSGAGNGFLLDAASSLELNGSIAWDVTAQPSTEWRGGGSVVFTYSDLHCDPPADGGDPGGEGCVYTDPLLVAPERHLFQPGPGSPCIGTGPDGQNMGYGSAAAIGGSMGLALFPYAYAQIEVLRHALTDFFEDDRLPLATVLDLIGRDENGLEILSPGGDPGAQTKYLRRLYRYLLLAYRFRLDAHLLNLVLTEPALFSLNTDASPFEPRRDDIHMLAGFTGLRDAFPDASAELVAYLRSSAAGTAVKPPAAALAAMFGWSEDAIKALLGDRVPLRLGPVIAIARAVELGERTGFDATLLNSLATDGLVFGSAGATPLLNAVAAVDEDLATGVEAIVTGLEREALKLFAIPLIDAASRPAGFPVTTDDELSDYLLMDVDMGVQTTSSRLVSATQSLQQYVERSRLGFEPRVFDVALSEKEWDWFGGYRTWQANRKVFVHPEDYVRPELRRDKTAIFRDLERSIANAPPTGEGLEHLVRKYLDQFLTIASLETVGSWFEPAERVAASLRLNAGAVPPGVTSGLATTEPPLFPSLTVESWVRVSAPEAPSSDLELIGLALPDGTQPGWRLFVDAATGSPTFEIRGAEGSLSVAAPAGTFDAGIWTHIGAVFEPDFPGGPRLTLYVDGAVADRRQKAVGAYPLTGRSTVRFGPTADISLAEVRLWPKARTAEQIRTDMHRAIPVGSPEFGDLSGLWQFRDETVSDRTGIWSSSATTGDLSFETPAIETAADAVTEDSWHFVGRTALPPYSYFHRTKTVHSFPGGEIPGDETAVWTGWEPIGLTINSRFVSPLVVDGRLHLFWVEGRETAADASTKPEPTPARYFGVIKYARRNADGTWAPARSPFPDVPLPGKLEDETRPAWLKPYVLPVAFEGQSAILVIYGQEGSSEDAVVPPATFILKWDDTVVTSVVPSEETLSGRFYWAVGSTPGEESTATLDAVGLKSILAANGFEPNPSIPHLTDALVSITNGHTFAYPIDDLGTALPLSSDYEFRFGDSTAFHKGNELSYLAVQDGTQVSLYGSEDPLDDQSWELLAPSILAVEHWPATWLTSLIADSGSIYLSTFSVPPKGSFPAVVASSPLAEITKVPWSSVPAPLDLLPPKAFIYNGVATIVSAFFYAKPIMLMASCADPEDLEDTSFFPPGTVFVQLSQPVFWEKTNAWYVLTAAADRTRQLWKCAGLHQESWSPCAHSPSAAGSDSNAPQSGLTLIATKGGLVCDSGPLLSEWTNDPDGAPWMPISGIPELKPAFGMTYETEIAVEILGDARQDSLAIPVTNQLAGWTFRNGADGFLVRARRSAGHPLDAQVRAYMREQGVVQIEGTGAPDMSSARFGFERLTTSVGPALSEALAVGGIAGLMSAASQNTAESDFSTLGPREVVDLPVDPEKISFSLGDAFGCYFREIFFFLPWLIAERLNAGGQCEAARTFYEYIFKPSDAGGGGDYWRSAWLAGAFAETAVDELERPDPAALARYREDPFDSGAIADLRPVAYQRAIVTAYVRNMIDWGDDEFSLDTRESVNRAAQLYRFAGELLGPRPRHIEYTPPAPVSYAELELQALNEFLISDERPGTADAPEAPVPLPPGAEPNGGVAGLGFYFGLPDSREFLSNWDLVEDRLEKIRGGLDITGAVDDLPLFEPPLSLDDIQTLGQTGGATGSDQGGSAADAASEAESRFLSMIYSARSMAAGVAELGGSLLRALEMGDAEALVALQLSQQTVVAERVREIRVQEVNSALENAAAVRSALQAATFRRDFYSAMIEAGWSAGEGIGIALATESLVPRTMSGVENSIAAPLFLLPEIFGLADGGSSPGGAMQAEAASSGDMASVLSESSSLANLIASYERRSQEWEFQKGMAEFDVTQLERQASIAERQLRSAQMQFSLDETTMQQTRAVSGYYSSKFTSEELYTWMSGTLEQLHQQMFQIALGMAQMAESTLSAITGEDRQVISTGGWSSQRKGLLSGETMIVDLARLEQAYWQWQSNDAAQTTTKRISLRRIDPVALLQLATTGSCTFRLSEELFDRDRPGQYLRTIQDLSLNLSGVDAHRHEIFGTLTCLGHETVRQPDGDAVEFLLGDTGRLPGTVLRRDTRARRASLSHMESGEPNAFASGDLAAFRGIGAVSTWRLDLPPSQNRIDLRELEDVILNMTFTSRDGGAAFRERVGAAMPPHRGSLLVDVPPVTGTVTDRAAVVPDSLPRNLAGKQFELSSMSLISDQAHPPAAAGARVLVDRPGASTQSVVLEPVSSTHGNLFRARLDEAIPEMASQTWSLEIGDGDHGAATDRHWMLVEYEEKDRPTPEVRT
ncbi:MAG TPA: neuraminidase-like domain-containing protein [Solirubrobacterales bacterium]|nr:neuraminidase-like domain-containing protein [Solirubrobacterales bacterium]